MIIKLIFYYFKKIWGQVFVCKISFKKGQSLNRSYLNFAIKTHKVIFCLRQIFFSFNKKKHD